MTWHVTQALFARWVDLHLSLCTAWLAESSRPCHVSRLHVMLDRASMQLLTAALHNLMLT